MRPPSPTSPSRLPRCTALISAISINNCTAICEDRTPAGTCLVQDVFYLFLKERTTWSSAPLRPDFCAVNTLKVLRAVSHLNRSCPKLATADRIWSYRLIKITRESFFFFFVLLYLKVDVYGSS